MPNTGVPNSKVGLSVRSLGTLAIEEICGNELTWSLSIELIVATVGLGAISGATAGVLAAGVKTTDGSGATGLTIAATVRVGLGSEPNGAVTRIVELYV